MSLVLRSKIPFERHAMALNLWVTVVPIFLGHFKMEKNAVHVESKIRNKEWPKYFANQIAV